MAKKRIIFGFFRGGRKGREEESAQRDVILEEKRLKLIDMAKSYSETLTRREREIDEREEALKRREAALEEREKNADEKEESAQIVISNSDNTSVESNNSTPIEETSANETNKASIDNSLYYEAYFAEKEKELELEQYRLSQIAEEQAKKAEEQAETDRNQKVKAEEQSRIAEEQEQRQRELDWRDGMQAFNEKKLKSRKDDLTSKEMVVSSKLKAIEEIEEGERKVLSAREHIKKVGESAYFESLIDNAINDFKEIISSINANERFTNQDLSSEKKFELFKLKAKMLGMLTAYIELDDSKTTLKEEKDKYFGKIKNEMVKMLNDHDIMDYYQNKGRGVDINREYFISYLTTRFPDYKYNIDKYLKKNYYDSYENFEEIFKVMSSDISIKSKGFYPETIYKYLQEMPQIELEGKLKNQYGEIIESAVTPRGDSIFVERDRKSKDIKANDAYEIYLKKSKEMDEYMR